MSTDAGQQIARVHGRELVRGTEVSIAGERGRFRFIRATTTSTDRIVFDFIGGTAGHECWRSFYPKGSKECTVSTAPAETSRDSSARPASSPRPSDRQNSGPPNAPVLDAGNITAQD